MPIVLDPVHLKTLSLSEDELKHLPENEQAKKIKKAWIKMCLTYHPDKNLNDSNAEQFQAITSAYKALKGKQSYVDEINQYFTPSEMTIPHTAFDIAMQEGILEVFQQLRLELSTLPTEEKKHEFAAYYAPFLTLAQYLESHTEQLMSVRVRALDQELETGIREFLAREWRMFIIRLFAEEYLDDFQYRHALAFKEVWPILATRKLVSPVKWLAALIGSLDLVFQGSAEYAMKQKRALLPQLLLVVSSPVSALNFFVTLMASPINNVIRPLSAYTGLPPVALTGLFSGIAALTLYGLMMNPLTGSLTAALLVLPYLNIALTLYSLYALHQQIQCIQEKGGTINTPMAILSVILILLNAIPGEPISSFLGIVVNLHVLQVQKKILTESPIEFLPLPEQPVLEEVKQAALLGYTKANQSHRFFGTPPNALMQNNRTFWQKTTSFFGVDHVMAKVPTPRFDEEPPNMMQINDIA